jgi:uncharacterized membrane protein
MNIVSGLFDSIAGLPLHPLVVHFAVVLLPLAGLALIAEVVVPRWADRFGWVSLAALVVGTGAAFVATQSGQALAQRVGEPEGHARYGGALALSAAVLLAVTVVWIVARRRAAKAGAGRTKPEVASGVATAVVALAVLVLSVLTGHSGAQAAWGGLIPQGTPTTVAPAPGPTAPTVTSPTTTVPTTPAPTTTSPLPPDSSPTTPDSGAITLAEVAQHADASSCWAAINGQVYDLTDWLGQHPGGAREIIPHCGTDATAAFTAQHTGQPRPAAELTRFLIGPLA